MVAKLIVDYANTSKLEDLMVFKGTFHDIGMLAQDFVCEFIADMTQKERKEVYCFRLEDNEENLLGYFRPITNMQGNIQFAFFFE
jgi:hypothetical protein